MIMKFRDLHQRTTPHANSTKLHNLNYFAQGTDAHHLHTATRTKYKMKNSTTTSKSKLLLQIKNMPNDEIQVEIYQILKQTTKTNKQRSTVPFRLLIIFDYDYWIIWMKLNQKPLV